MLPLVRLLVLFPLLVLGACGGGGDDDNDPPATPAPEPTPPPPPARGSLVQSPAARTASMSSTEVLTVATADDDVRQILQFLAAPKCGIDVHKLYYNTVDPKGAATTATGAMMVPTGSDAACQGARPIVVYAHGTTDDRTFNIADLTDEDNAEGLLIAVAFAAQGYIVVAPNYAGYDQSALTYHPYLNADQQSKDTADALTAARASLPTSFAPGVTYSTKLFITGYSQGGYVAMATHRLLQQTGVAVTAAAPMSGPYALAAFGDAVFQGQVVLGAAGFAAFITTGYQRAYGDIYTSPTAIFEAAYAPGIESLLPAADPAQLAGKLPDDQLFSNTPPDPAFASFTPATTPANLAGVFALGFGPNNLVTNSFRLAYLQDAQANPDGGFPAVTDGRPAANPTTGLRKAFKTNDLRNWLPTSPVLLCAGHEDPTVLYMNTQLIQSYWSANGVTAPIRVLDVDDSSSGNPDADLKVGFAVAKAASGDGAQENYHAGLVAPFCLAATRRFFDSM